jgi:hypothetical protein
MSRPILTPEQLQADTDRDGKTTTFQRHAVNVTAKKYVREYLGNCAADVLFAMMKVYTSAPIPYLPTQAYAQGNVVQKGEVILIATRAVPSGVAFSVGDFYKEEDDFEDATVASWWVDHLRKAVSNAVKYKLLPTVPSVEHGGGIHMPSGGGNVIISARALEQTRQVYIDVAENFATEAMRELKVLAAAAGKGSPICELYDAYAGDQGCGCSAGTGCTGCGGKSNYSSNDSAPFGFG